MSAGGVWEDQRSTMPESSWSTTQAMILDSDPLTTNITTSSDSQAASLETPAGSDTHVEGYSAAFPSESSQRQGSRKKRVSSQKRRLSQGHIPRPRNAFFLFRADFIKERHIPGSAETNHNTLSKIIGNHWRSLPPEEKHVWEVKAQQEKAAHKIKYPEYRFRPVHNKHKKAPASVTHSALLAVAKSHAKRSQARNSENERGWEEVNQLLLQGKKGDELVRAVEELDRARDLQRLPELQSDSRFQVQRRHFTSAPVSRDSTPQADFLQQFSLGSPMGMGAAPRHRRSSSAPQPSGPMSHPIMRPIALPTLSPVISRPTSPSFIPSISRFRQGTAEPSNPSHHSNQGRLVPPFTQDTRLHPSAPYLGGYSPEPMRQAYLNPVPGMDQASLGFEHHHRFALSQLQSSPPVLRRACTTPALMHDSSSPMTTLDDFPDELPFDHSTEVVQPSFGGFDFDSHSHSDTMDLLQAPDQTDSYNSSTFAPSDATAAEHVVINGTINPASLMRCPGSSAPRISPLDTSMFSIPQPSAYSSEPSSAISAGSTPMMIPSSPFPSPAPSNSSIASSFDGFDGDIDIAALLDVNCMHLDELYPDNRGVSGMPFHLPEPFGMGEESAFYGFNGEPDAVSPLHLEEDGALYSKMLDMPTPTQATFGMESS